MKWVFTERGTRHWLVVEADVWFDARDIATRELSSTDLECQTVNSRLLLPDFKVKWVGTDAGSCGPHNGRRRIVDRL